MVPTGIGMDIETHSETCRISKNGGGTQRVTAVLFVISGSDMENTLDKMIA